MWWSNTFETAEPVNPEDVLTGYSPEVMDFVQALGLDPTEVKRVVLDIPAGDIATLYVEKYVSRQALQVLANLPKAPKVVILDEGNHAPEDRDQIPGAEVSITNRQSMEEIVARMSWPPDWGASGAPALSEQVVKQEILRAIVGAQRTEGPLASEEARYIA